MSNILKHAVMEEERGILGVGDGVGQHSLYGSKKHIEDGIYKTIESLMIRLNAGTPEKIDKEDIDSNEYYYAFDFMSENNIFESNSDLWKDGVLNIVVRYDNGDNSIESLEFSASFSSTERDGEEMTVSRTFVINMEAQTFIEKGCSSIVGYSNFFQGLVRNFTSYVLT